MNFSRQELFCVGIFLTQRKRQNNKQSAMIAALLKIEHKYPKMDMNAEKLMQLAVEYRVLQKNQSMPIPKTDLADNCDVKLRGTRLKCLSVLHDKGTAHEQPWLDIERKCLSCCVEQNKTEDQTTLQELFEDLAPYFDRTTSALSQEWANINRK